MILPFALVLHLSDNIISHYGSWFMFCLAALAFCSPIALRRGGLVFCLLSPLAISFVQSRIYVMKTWLASRLGYDLDEDALFFSILLSR